MQYLYDHDTILGGVPAEADITNFNLWPPEIKILLRILQNSILMNKIVQRKEALWLMSLFLASARVHLYTVYSTVLVCTYIVPCVCDNMLIIILIVAGIKMMYHHYYTSKQEEINRSVIANLS